MPRSVSLLINFDGMTVLNVELKSMYMLVTQLTFMKKEKMRAQCPLPRLGLQGPGPWSEVWGRGLVGESLVAGPLPMGSSWAQSE